MSQSEWSELIELVQALKNEIREPAPVVGTYRVQKKLVAPISEPSQAAPPVNLEAPAPVFNSKLEEWIQKYVKVVQPIPPILCFGNHPLLIRLCTVLSQQIAPAECTMTMPPLNHPLLKLLLIPLQLLKKDGFEIHKFSPPFLPLHPIEKYVQEESLKRQLWNTIQSLPLFS